VEPEERVVNSYDGPTLRAIRESIGVPLRRIARTAGMSHGHLSKVERGEHGRPVTPTIVAAYERVTGVRLAEAAARITEQNRRQTGRAGAEWTPGKLTDMRRRGYNAAVGALAVGGHLGEPVNRLIDATGRPLTPAPPDEGDLGQLEELAELLTGLDLRCGGGLASQLTKTLLRWAVPMLDATGGLSRPQSRRLYSVVGGIAHRAGWAGFDVAAHEAARSLFRLALYTAVLGGDHNLRAHVLADVAAQHNQLGYHEDALELIRLAEGDERVAPGVRMILHGVKARTYAALGEAEACRRQIDAAEDAFTDADPGLPGWVGRLANPAILSAATGHAMAALAGHTGAEADRKDASRRLTQAIDAYNIGTHARAHALCQARLALLHLGSADPDEAAEWTTWTRQRLPAAEGIHSGRLAAELAQVRAAIDPRTSEGEPAGGGQG
jgi:transcriptional regulator with XRE-family HTH domain